MGLTTGIQWADATLNLWWGCVEVAPGCDHCYARTLSKRYGHDVWGAKGPRLEVKSWRSMLGRLQRNAEEQGRDLRVFCGSMMDVFEKTMPLVDRAGNEVGWTNQVRQALFDGIVKGRYPNLHFQFLTKRPSNIPYIYIWNRPAPPNVWFGTSVTGNRDHRYIEQLIEHAPAGANLFLSAEPLTGRLDLRPYLDRLHWVIVGGESGPQARACDTHEISLVVRDCREANVPVFVKQLGARPIGFDAFPLHLVDSHGGDPDEWPQMLRVREEMPLGGRPPRTPEPTAGAEGDAAR